MKALTTLLVVGMFLMPAALADDVAAVEPQCVCPFRGSQL